MAKNDSDKAGSMSFVSLAKFTCTYEIRKSNSTRADFGLWQNKDPHFTTVAWSEDRMPF
jgi:hypothetical protein